jgi:hypothetical protein
MPEGANSLVSGLFAGTLSAAALVGLSTTASSATECLENPDLRTAKLGHWYYHSDWTQHRRCWFFVPAEVTADTPVSAPPTAIVGDHSIQSLLSYFTASFSQPPSPPPQQMEVLQPKPNTIPDRSGEATQTISPKPTPNQTVGDYSIQSLLSYLTASFSQPPSPPPQQMEVLQPRPNTIPDRSGEAPQAISPKPARPNKTLVRERPQIAPPPTTTRVAVRRDQPEQSASNERPNLPLDEADREALFQEFVKWQLDRKLSCPATALPSTPPPAAVEQAGIH